MSERLKPCPLCLSPDPTEQPQIYRGHVYISIRCMPCDLSIDAQKPSNDANVARVVNRWNTRPGQDALADLKTQNKSQSQRLASQARDIEHKDKNLRKKNLALDALHYVWCDGSTRQPLTEEIVAEAERNTARMRRALGGEG